MKQDHRTVLIHIIMKQILTTDNSHFTCKQYMPETLLKYVSGNNPKEYIKAISVGIVLKINGIVYSVIIVIV